MKLRLAGTSVVRDPAALSPEVPPGLHAVRDGHVVWVYARGETYRIESFRERPGVRADAVEHDLLAPMPGKVTKVLVEAGAPVTRGAPLLVLEAMKMEHEIRSPKDGVVARVHRKAGEMVALGDRLVEVD